MFQYVYDWTQNFTFYIVLVTVVLHAVPDSGYKKYIRFFTGMVLILMMVTPIFRIFGKDSQIMNFYKSREYEAKLKEIEHASDYLKDMDPADFLKETGERTEEQEINEIRVEEIQIERDKETDRHAEDEKD